VNTLTSRSQKILKLLKKLFIHIFNNLQKVEKVINKMLIRVAELESRKIFTEEEVIVGREEDLEGH
jgi:hypothetical protein